MSKFHLAEIIEILEKALELGPGSLNEDSSTENTDAWDSLGQLSILVALDKHFAGKISSITDMAGAVSVKEIFKTLKDNSII
jgi:acyl carrier protein